LQSSPFLRIGSRGSALALVQARLVRRRLAQAHQVPEETIEIRTITTSGDRLTEAPLSEVGGKGLFSKEIEGALEAGEIDLGVHSSKDMATRLPDGLVLAAFLEREDMRDAFVSLTARSIVRPYAPEPAVTRQTPALTVRLSVVTRRMAYTPEAGAAVSSTNSQDGEPW